MSVKEFFEAAAMTLGLSVLCALFLLPVGAVVHYLYTSIWNGECRHKWNKWGDPVKDDMTPYQIQYRKCEECNAVEGRPVR